jgi:DNA-binding transcriptional LysR family regulator
MRGMEWLNYHHLRYFWAAVREGTVTRASQKLRVSQPAVSAQIRALEQALGEKLLTRSGRRARRRAHGHGEMARARPDGPAGGGRR